MIPLINQAMMLGFSANQILKYISGKVPKLKQGMENARASGFDDERILKFLSQKIPTSKQGSEKQLNANDRYMSSAGYKTKEERESSKSRALQGIIGVGSAALSTYALARALPSSVSSLVSAVSGAPQQNQTLQPSTTSETIQQDQKSLNELPLQPPINTNIVQQQQTLPQPELKTIDSKQVLQNNNFIDKIESLINSGNDAESIEGFYQKFNPSAVKKIEKEAGKPFREVVSEYMQSKLAEKPPEELPPEFPGEEPPRPPKPKYPPPPEKGGLLSRKAIEESFKKATPSKGSIVDTPNGIGEVREIRNGKALVEVDGKMRKMLEEELMEPGLPQKDLADLHEELIEGIKQQTGKEVSRHVEWAGYDPEHKELVYRPWGDKEYVYDNIDPEDVEMLTNLLTQRKTTGENYIGSWEAGTESPIGAAMHALITKVRNKAKESGQEKAHKRRYEAVYSAYEPAQKASKQKKDAEKKRLKDEEKRRKAKEKQALQHSRSPSRVS